MSEPAVQTANPVTAQPSGALSRDRSNSELATLASKLDKSSTAIDAIGCAPSLTGQVAIVTGGNGGVGKAAALALAAGGAHVIIGCRSLSRGAAAAKEMNELLESDSVWPTVQVGGLVLGSKRRAAEQGRVEVMELDVSSLDSVRAFVAAFNARSVGAGNGGAAGNQLDMLLCNAGIMAPGNFQASADGHEMQWATNYLGHFLLSQLLLPNLKASSEQRGEPARVVNVASIAHATGSMPMNIVREPAQGGRARYNGYKYYARSKLAQVMHANEMKKREPEVSWFSVHPGVISTGLGADAGCCSFTRFLYACPSCPCTPTFVSIEQGAATGVRCLTDPTCAPNAGGYFSECQHHRVLAADARDAAKQAQLFEQSLKDCGL